MKSFTYSSNIQSNPVYTQPSIVSTTSCPSPYSKPCTYTCIKRKTKRRERGRDRDRSQRERERQRQRERERERERERAFCVRSIVNTPL